jgi:dipeptidyl aminopeptidase/acylaminoacyl peptidase
MMRALRCHFQHATMAMAALLTLFIAATGSSQTIYHKPSQDIETLIKAPSPLVASVSPAHDKLLLSEPVRFPDISDLAQPMLRIAGLRIDPTNNGIHVPQRLIHWQLVDLASGAAQPLAIPDSVYAGAPIWSPDGRRFVFPNYSRKAVELWMGDAHSGAVHRVGALALNAVIEPAGRGGNIVGGGPIVWMPDNQHLLVRLVPSGRGAAPQEPAVVSGPIVQEADADPSPVPTIEDLLTNPHEEDLFTYYATAQLALVDASSGKAQMIGEPGIFTTNAPSPDGTHILVGRIHKPYSYLVAENAFPRLVEIWDMSGHMSYKLADLPLAEHTPINGAPTGPRAYEWMPTQGATLVWAEALDGGDPRKEAPYRDHILSLSAPFTGTPVELAKTEQRFVSLEWGSNGDLAILRDNNHRTATNRVFFFDPKQPGQALRLVFTLNARSQYDNPGNFVQQTLPNGQPAVLEADGAVFLTGNGASPQGDHPFLDRFDIHTLKTQRLFHSGAEEYERVTALLAPDGSRFLTSHESPKDPPNYFVRSASGENRAVSHFTDPTNIAGSIHSELVTYQRGDGVPLSMTVYLPPGYKQGERRPAIMVGYPYEYTDAKVAGQVTGSPYRYKGFGSANLSAGGGVSPLYLLLAGYVVLNDVSLPIVGLPNVVNDTFVDQLVADAKATIDKAAAMGVIDPNRVGVTGHSYGAFMTANLLAHSNLFRAGVAQSGAYNRTLTPFQFQSERRTFWQAPTVYENMSPFFFADKLKAPIMLIHGMADNNNGTFPIQSLRMYEALQGNGGTVRYIQLPYESHGYIGQQSIEEVVWEITLWFDKYVKNAPAGAASAGISEGSER